MAGLTTNISSNTSPTTFHYSFLRNWWQWGPAGDPPYKSPGLAGALEPFGESRDQQSSVPYNVNTQQTRTRFWDGKDHMFRDDVTVLKGNHLFQFGGTLPAQLQWPPAHRQWWRHQLPDGVSARYDSGTGHGRDIGLTYPTVLDRRTTTGGRDYAAMLGIVSVSQIAYTRTGPNLTLNPPLTPAFDQSTIPYYNVYFSDTWHMKPTFTLTYGLGWTLEMPPVEKNGKQVEFVDQSNQPIDAQAYLASRQRAALLGQVFNPRCWLCPGRQHRQRP